MNKKKLMGIVIFAFIIVVNIIGGILALTTDWLDFIFNSKIVNVLSMIEIAFTFICLIYFAVSKIKRK